MAKELPYFKFEPSLWDSGKIQMCSLEAQGLFINICSLYWARLGDLPEKLVIHKLCNGNANALQELCNEEILHMQDEKVCIYFLDEQLKEFQELSKKRSEVAQKRWGKQSDKKKVNANALQTNCKSNAIREDKRREEEIREEYIPQTPKGAEKKSESSASEENEKEKSCVKKEKDFGKPDFKQSLIDHGANPQHVDDWLKVRTTKRATFTETALNRFLNECENNNFPVAEAVRICAEKSWQGFEYQWVLNQQSNARTTKTNDLSNLKRLSEGVMVAVESGYVPGRNN